MGGAEDLNNIWCTRYAGSTSTMGLRNKPREEQIAHG
jgi:hypothetical protein